MIAFNMKVSIAENAVHSGVSGGAIPETFRIANSLLDRIEDPETRRIPHLEVEIPEAYKEEAKEIAKLSGDFLYTQHNFLDGCKAMNQDNLPELYLNTNWRPSLAVTGADGLPALSKAGNVVRASTTLRCSIRCPPGKNTEEGLKDTIEILSKDIPYGAKVEFLDQVKGDGWAMKELSEKTKNVLNDASSKFYGKECGKYGIGGSIPFLKVLGDKYPATEILALGVLGPLANAHAPNETLDLPFTKKFIAALSHILPGLSN
jgi:acetylornithine deacetylase/succinyl-diaminopimelate desuccinylase-like protein